MGDMARGRWALAAGVTALAVVVLIWGSGAGSGLLGPPRDILPQFTPSSDEVELPAMPEIEQQPVRPDEQEPAPEVDLSWARVLVYIAVALGLVALLVTLAIAVLRHLQNRTDDLDPVEDDEIDLLLEASSPERRAVLLAEGDPRNAIVACWVALEDAAEGAGLVRSPAETSAEFTEHVLHRWAVPTEVIAELGALYRHARFSTHPVNEDERRHAIAALEQIHTALEQARRAAEEQARKAAEEQAQQRAQDAGERS